MPRLRSLRLSFSSLGNAPKCLVSADENVAIGYRERRIVRLAEGIGGQQFKLRTRFEHEGISGMVDGIEPAIGQNHRRPR